MGEAGEAQGLSPGQTLTAARAVCPALVPVDADPAADEAALGRLAAWCERYTPMAAPDPPDGLWLDITGCTAVFADEAELARDLAARLARNGIPCRDRGCRDDRGAAWALTHAGAGIGRMMADQAVRTMRRWPICRSPACGSTPAW